MRLPFITCLITAMVFAGPVQAEICKWVDEDGVTHFSKYCPDDVDGDKIVVEEGPTQQQSHDVKRNAQQLYDKRSQRREAEEIKSDQQARDARQARAEASRRESNCRKAGRSLKVLTTQRPVFYDNRNTLHHDREGFAYTYEGPRRYLEDEERAQLIQQWTNTQLENCE